jgi:fatty-acyl-CoA synthase
MPDSRPFSPAKAWARALELTAPIANQPERILAGVLDEVAERQGDSPALLSDRETFTYRALVERSRQYARWALAHDLTSGAVVCLFMPNRPEYLAIWLGITRVGGIVSLLNTNLTGSSLAHCINLVSPRHVIVAAELADRFNGAREGLSSGIAVSVHGEANADLARIDLEVDANPAGPLTGGENRRVTIEDRALYIYTSGTTGLPKAANISHARLLQWSLWFAGMMDTQTDDRMYNCLPMYHSVGGVLATGAVLAGGGSVVVRESFSARQFWPDVVRWDCTLVQYIGELCRYLVNADVNPQETAHHIRMCCGNGLRPDVWGPFKDRFRIPHIFEFYAATEGNVSMFNVEGKPGAIGRVPPFLAHRFPTALIKLDVEAEQPVRNDQGWCVRCGANEVGEAIGPLLEDRSNIGGRFEGYTNREASEKKLLRDVFKPGDAWFRTGDLLRRDEKGYFYFVDRIGDTFRWKGENVATSEVSEALCSFPGITQANVYGVTIPRTDGRAGMAAIVASQELDLAALRCHLGARLPDYARPVFLRISGDLDTTATFKFTKSDLVKQGFDPRAVSDRLYVDSRGRERFEPLDERIYELIQSGAVRF